MSLGRRRSKPTSAILRPANPVELHQERSARQRSSRELRVLVPKFRIANQRKTNAQIQAAADKVLPFMENDAAPLRELAEKLEDLCDAVAKAPSLDAVPENSRQEWDLGRDAFDELRAATDTPERRDDLRRRIESALDRK